MRDVATAHVLAALSPTAKGRYIVSQPASLSARAFTDILKTQLNLGSIPDGKEAPVKSNIDNTRVQRELGLELTPPEKTIADMANSLIVTGFAVRAA